MTRRALTLIAAAVAGLAFAQAAGAAPMLPLGHAGRWTTDADGRVVILHGVNMVYKIAPYAPDQTGFGDDDAAFLAAEGYNNVRVGIIYKAVEPQPGVYDDAYLDRIAGTVDTLGRHGIVSMLDFHQDLFNERFQGEGWPDWAVQDDGLPNQPGLGFPGNYVGMPALWRAFDHFWDNDPGPGDVGLGDRYAAAWRHVAERFRDDNNVLGYELLNEPWPGSLWQECANPFGCPVFDAKLAEFSKRTIAAIRTVDPRTLVFYEPNVLFNDGADTQLGAIGDPHAGFAFHDYCLPAGSTQNNIGCDFFDDVVFANALKRSAATGDTLLMTEFGATESAEIIQAMVDRADRNMVGWQWWHYCGCADPTTSGPGDTQAVVLDPSKPPEGSNLKAAKLGLLSRPYPQVIAGTPRSFGFDAATKTFTLRYSPKRADGSGAFAAAATTEVVLPARQYPDGYAVQVTDGTIRSARGARLLRVTACAGAETVSIAVKPGKTTAHGCKVSGSIRRAARLRVSVAPRYAVAGRRTAFRIRVRVLERGRLRVVRHATVRLAGARGFTDRRGRVVLRKRFRRSGRYTVRASAKGLRRGSAVVTVRASA